MREKTAASRTERPLSSWYAPTAMLAVGVAVSSAGAWRYWLSPAPMSAPTPVAVQKAPSIPPTPENLSELEPVLIEEIAACVRNANDWPDLPEPRGRLGLLYEAHGYSELAMQCYAGAYALEPADPHWRYLWAVLAQKAGDKDAEDAFREVIAKKPEYAPAHERLGLLLLEANAYEEASEAMIGIAFEGRYMITKDTFEQSFRPMVSIPGELHILEVKNPVGRQREL